jgi:predicted aspartyl protease
MPGPFTYLWTDMPPVPGGGILISWGNKSKACAAVIDTGASHTCIPASIANELHLRQVEEDVIVVSGPQRSGEKRNVYVSNFSFLGFDFHNHPVVSIEWHEVLIGRDIINKWLLTLDGPKQVFTIEVP